MAARCPAPGVYDLDIDLYHGVEIAPGPSISGSGLISISDLMGGCPARFWWDSTMNPKREDVDTEALHIGRAVHTLTLEGRDEFNLRFGVLDEGMDLRTNAGKARKAEIEDRGQTMIRWNDFLKINAMADEVQKHPRAKMVFQDGAPEKTLVWQDEITGVWCRARPDWLPNDRAFIPDLKSTADAAKAAFERSVWAYGYHMKIAHICEGIRVLGLGDPQGAYFVAQEKAAPYLVAVYVLNREALEWGAAQNRVAIETFARCQERDHWPGYSETVQEINLPAWAQSQLTAADLTASIPQKGIHQ